MTLEEGQVPSYFTESQEEAIKDIIFASEIEMDPSMQFSLSGLEANLSQEYKFGNCGPYIDQNNIPEDNKMAVFQPQVAVHQITHQITQTPILGKEEFAGQFEFKLVLNPTNSGKHWVYSETLSKVFINMDQVLPVQFQWTPIVDGLWVRATMVYKLDQHRSQPVVRCHNHMAPDNASNRNIDQRQIKHVVRCLHSTSTYEESSTGHLSVLTPLGTPEAGVDNVPMDFKFCCKNSCASGMNRRSTEIIFTLENDQSVILGRRKLEVRVCSCPKRDKEKEESEVGNSSSIGIPAGKKRKLIKTESMNPPPGKKIATDNKVYNINFNILGKENANLIIQYAYNLMAGGAMKNGNAEPYKPYLEELSRKHF